MLTYNLRPGWRVAQIDRTRFYITNDCDLEGSIREHRIYRTREQAQRRVNELNARKEPRP